MEVGDFRVVDAHVHIQPWEQLKPEVAKVMGRGRPDLEDIKRFIQKSGEFIRFLDEENIARVALINYPAEDLMGFGPSVNDYCAAYRNEHPDRIIAFGGVHPRLSEDPEGEIAHALDVLELDGIKIHPPHQLVQPNDHVNGNETLRLLYQRCEEKRVPVMIHTGTSIFPKARGKYGDPIAVDDVAVDFPKLPIIMAHGGRPLWMDTAFHLVRRHRNVYLDLSGIPPQAVLEYFPRLESIADKCLFGTDWPSPGVKSIRRNVDAIAALPISDEAKQRIFAGTADELFPPR
jgi:predicted TIM-barrel fold metal-dependent hydrolase